MGKPKQFTRPPKKQKPKVTTPQTADDFQEAADLEEETGGKWRAGDPAKSGRAFVRALEIYDRGLQRFPKNFDLAYNKARLEFEITQRPALVSHIGLPLISLLQQTLDSHRYALRLNEENADMLFNTSQVMTSLAEQLSEAGDSAKAIPLLQEALELLSGCLARQEMMLEQQQADFGDVDEGGVTLDSDEKQASTPGSEQSEQTAVIEDPVTASDLLDTVHASLSALTTLVAQVEQHQIDGVGSLAQSLTEQKAPLYMAMLPDSEVEAAQFAMALDRANFVAAFADAQYNAYLIDAGTYSSHLSEVHDIPGKDRDAIALVSEAEARTELVLSVLSRNEVDTAAMCWKQLAAAQELYTKATKLEISAQIYLARGDVELLRHRLAMTPAAKLSDGARKSAPTLALNAQTYYKGAARLANDDEDAAAKSQSRLVITAALRRLMYGVESDAEAIGGVPPEALSQMVDDGLLETTVAEDIMARSSAHASSAG